MSNYIQSISLLAAVFACGFASAGPKSNAAAVAEVTQFERSIEAFDNSPELALHPESALKFYAKDVRFFDIMLPVEFRGDQFSKHVIDIGKQFEGGQVKFLELEVIAEPGMACATSLQHFVGKTAAGKPYDMTMRVTDFLQKKRGRWIITHEHISLPLDQANFMSVIAPKSSIHSDDTHQE
jgi:ketosteroid isomerase-like protein